MGIDGSVAMLNLNNDDEKISNFSTNDLYGLN